MAIIQKLTPLGRQAGEPIKLDGRRRRLSTITRQHCRGRRCLVYRVPRGEPFDAERHVVRRSLRSQTLIGKNDTIIILPLVGNSGGGSRNGLAKAGAMALTIAAIALVVFQPYLVGALTPMLGAFGAQAVVGTCISPLIIGGSRI